MICLCTPFYNIIYAYYISSNIIFAIIFIHIPVYFIYCEYFNNCSSKPFLINLYAIFNFGLHIITDISCKVDYTLPPFFRFYTNYLGPPRSIKRIHCLILSVLLIYLHNCYIVGI